MNDTRDPLEKAVDRAAHTEAVRKAHAEGRREAYSEVVREGEKLIEDFGDPNTTSDYGADQRAIEGFIRPFRALTIREL